MSYSFYALLSIFVLSAVHLFAAKIKADGRFLSFGGGVAIAYVFIDLLPKLAKSDLLVSQTLHGLFPYFERHVYILALLGFILFFVVEKGDGKGENRFFHLSLAAYSLFNFLVGYAVVDKDDPEVQPLLLFTFAMALHYFTNDYTLETRHGADYRRFGRWILIASLFLGWLVGLIIAIPGTAVALISAFIGGGVIMNVTRHELPRSSSNSVVTFVLAALLYTVILLVV